MTVVAAADLEWIVERVRAHYDATAIYLFGSQAKGTPGEGSDVDLLIVGPSRLPRHRRGLQVAAALSVFPSHFDLLFFTDEELAEARTDRRSFISSAMLRAKVLYRRE